MNEQAKFKVIVSDCPWSYSNFRKKAHGAASAQYKTMSKPELLELPVNSWADKDCIHFMWATWPHLDAAVDIMQAWGFKYKTGFPWIKTVNDKIRTGIGFYTRSVSEIVLIGTKGVPKRLTAKKETPPGLLVGDDEIFYAPTGKHSKKPEEFQDWVDRSYAGPKLELFSRRKKPGWTCWGLETGFELTKEGVTQTTQAAKLII